MVVVVRLGQVLVLIVSLVALIVALDVNYKLSDTYEQKEMSKFMKKRRRQQERQIRRSPWIEKTNSECPQCNGVIFHNAYHPNHDNLYTCNGCGILVRQHRSSTGSAKNEI